MKQTEEYIITEALKVMEALGKLYDKSQEVRAIFTSLEEQIKDAESVKDHAKYEEYIATFRAYWTVGFDFPPEVELPNNAMFLYIDDETGEAYLLSHRDAAFKIGKQDGKYLITAKRKRGEDFPKA